MGSKTLLKCHHRNRLHLHTLRYRLTYFNNIFIRWPISPSGSGTAVNRQFYIHEPVRPGSAEDAADSLFHRS